MTEPVTVEVVFAGNQSAVRRSVQLPFGATVADAIKVSGIAEHIEGFDPSRIGVFGRLVDSSTLLRDGDRVEIYRPLKIDPKEARRRRARTPSR